MNMQNNNGKKLKMSFSSMGTEIEIQIVFSDENGISRSGEYFQNIEKIYAKAMGIFNRFDPQSELSIINANIGKLMPCSDWMINVAKIAIKYNKETEGLFDPRMIGALENAGYRSDFKTTDFSKVEAGAENEKKYDSNKSLEKDLVIQGDKIIFKCRMDFAGVAKGFVTDEVAKYLKSVGMNDFLVDSGGDIYVSGNDEDGNLWNIGVEGIAEEKMILHLSDKSVATSGISRRKWEIGGQRRHHIVDPRQPGIFSFDLKSVTVVSSSVQEADVWAKTLFIMGENKGKIFAEQHDLKCIFLNYRGGAWISPAIKEDIIQ